MSREINSYVHYHEYDEAFKDPLLVIQQGGLSTGYEMNPDTGKILNKTCICSSPYRDGCYCDLMSKITDTTASGNSSRGQYIITNSGSKFYLTDIRPEEIFIEDIAHSLCNQQRFTGHLSQPWSVGQHSLALALWASAQSYSKKEQLTFLLHDASEAYLSDIARPAKRILPEYSLLEEGIHQAIASKWGLIYPHPSCLKEADYRITINEVLCFATNKDIYGDWGFEVGPLEKGMNEIIKDLSSLTPVKVKSLFISSYKEFLNG